MCIDEQPFTTVVGPRGSVERLIDMFGAFDVVGRLGLREPPTLIDIAAIDRQFREKHSPAVAVIFHPEAKSFPVARRLQVELLTGAVGHKVSPIPDLLCEPGFEVRAAAPAAPPTVARAAIAHIRANVPTIAATDRAAGSRVALLDTGDLNASNAMVDFTVSPPMRVTTDDENGHGTAVAAIITGLNASAHIYPVRVLGPTKNTGLSYQILPALEYALWSGAFDIVNASLTTTPPGMCEQTLGASIDYIVQLCRAANRALPVIVAAAGNEHAKNCGYPAVVPDAVVAVALDEDTSSRGTYVRASYNSILPIPVKDEEAYGGSSANPIGSVTASGATTDLWGTSFAAAAITAAYLP